MIRTAVRGFAEKEVAPAAGKRDEEERFDRELFLRLAELGLTGILLPELYGGAGGDALSFAVAVEELARVCASTGAALGAHTNAGWLVCRYGGAALKREWLPGLASGEKLGVCVFPYASRLRAAYRAPPSATGSGRETIHQAEPAGGIRYREEDGDYRLHGTHPFVNGAAEADLFIVHAAGPGNSRARGGHALTFAVGKTAPGAAAGPGKRKLGFRSWPAGGLAFQRCRILQEHVVGETEKGREIAASSQSFRHISEAAQAVGIMQGALEAAVAYAKERKQFGERIGGKQGVSFKLADMAAKLDASRLLTYQAAWRLDAGLPWGKQAAAAGVFAVKSAVAAAIEAVQVFGGYGYMREFRVERFLRDAKCLQANAAEGSIREEAVKLMLSDD